MSTETRGKDRWNFQGNQILFAFTNRNCLDSELKLGGSIFNLAFPSESCSTFYFFHSLLSYKKVAVPGYEIPCAGRPNRAHQEVPITEPSIYQHQAPPSNTHTPTPTNTHTLTTHTRHTIFLHFTASCKTIFLSSESASAKSEGSWNLFIKDDTHIVQTGLQSCYFIVVVIFNVN